MHCINTDHDIWITVEGQVDGCLLIQNIDGIFHCGFAWCVDGFLTKQTQQANRPSCVHESQCNSMCEIKNKKTIMFIFPNDFCRVFCCCFFQIALYSKVIPYDGVSVRSWKNILRGDGLVLFVNKNVGGFVGHFRVVWSYFTGLE